MSGNLASRVFDVTRGTVLISNLTVRDGLADDGAGIRNAGTLTVSHCTISGNRANVDGGAGIFNSGVLTVDGCTLSANNADTFGGGIHNDGTASIKNTLFDHNDADSGGGIFNDGTLSVMGCAFVGNHAFALGGGLRNDSGATALRHERHVQRQRRRQRRAAYSTAAPSPLRTARSSATPPRREAPSTTRDRCG